MNAEEYYKKLIEQGKREAKRNVMLRQAKEAEEEEEAGILASKAYARRIAKSKKEAEAKKEKETIKQVHKKTDDYLTEQVKKHNKTNVKLQSEKAEKILKEMQDLMDEVSSFEIPKPVKKPKLPKKTKKAVEPKKKSKAQLEREMIEENNRPEVQGRKRIKYILDKLSVNVQMIENAIDVMKKVSKDAYEASSEIKELYKTNKSLFEKYKEEGVKELDELKVLSNSGIISVSEIMQLLADANAGKYFDSFQKYKKYKPKF